MHGEAAHAAMDLVIPEKTDRAVRTFLARTGGEKGDLSRFVDEAVRRRVLDLTVRAIKDRYARYDQQEILDRRGGERGESKRFLAFFSS